MIVSVPRDEKSHPTQRKVEWACDCGNRGRSQYRMLIDRPCCRKCCKGNVSKHPLRGAWCNIVYGRKSRKADRVPPVVPEWHDFMAFVRDVHPRPEGHVLTRLDNSRPYGPDNFQWVTRARLIELCDRKKRLITVNGVSRRVSTWCRILGLPESTVRNRLDRGWTGERALMGANNA